MAFGQRLRQVRERAGISQRGLAAKTGMDQSFLSQVENGRHSISVDRMLVLAEALGVTPEELVSGLEPPRGETKGQRP